MSTRNPEQDVIDTIGELVDEQLSGYAQRSGYDYNINQDKCAICGREWHVLVVGGCPGPYGTEEQKTAYQNTANPTYGRYSAGEGRLAIQVLPTMMTVPPVPSPEEIAALIERPVYRLHLPEVVPISRSAAYGLPSPAPDFRIIEVETASLYDQMSHLITVRITERRGELAHECRAVVHPESLLDIGGFVQCVPMAFVAAQGWLQMVELDGQRLLIFALNGFERSPDRVIRMAIPGMQPVRAQ